MKSTKVKQKKGMVDVGSKKMTKRVAVASGKNYHVEDGNEGSYSGVIAEGKYI